VGTAHHHHDIPTTMMFGGLRNIHSTAHHHHDIPTTLMFGGQCPPYEISIQQFLLCHFTNIVVMIAVGLMLGGRSPSVTFPPTAPNAKPRVNEFSRHLHYFLVPFG
jgi:hypothetical protein